MLRKTLFYTLFILIFGSSVSAQGGLRKINWEDGKLFAQTKSFGLLPVFSDNIPIRFLTGKVSVNLLNAVYQEVDANEYLFLKNLPIKPAIEIKSERKIISKENFLFYQLTPLRINPENGVIEKLMSFDVDVEIVPEFKRENSFKFKSESVLVNGKWFKIKISSDGIYRISYDDLLAMGMDVNNIDPQNLRIYGNGGGMLPESNSDIKYDDLNENAIMVEGESDGHFDVGDCILFYGQSPDVWKFDELTQKYSHVKHAYSDYTYYFITADHGKGKRIEQQSLSNQSPNFQVTEFEDHVFYEQDNYNLINSGRNWYGEVFDATTVRSFDFNFPNLIKSKEIQLNLEVAVRSSISSKFEVSVNGSNINQIMVSGINFSAPYSPFALTGNLKDNFLSDTDHIALTLNYNKLNTISKAWLDKIELVGWRELKLEGSQMSFRNPESFTSDRVSNFILNGANASTNIWNVTDPLNVKRVNGELNGTVLSFILPTDSLLEFVAFNGDDYLSAEFVEEVNNQNYHALPSVDLIIVSPPEFHDQALRLAEFHSNHDGLSYCIVEPGKIYNEFSSGAQDISAIRNFVRMLYERENTVTPRYLLLFGDASFDYKDRIAGNTNFVPTWESPFSTAIIASYNTDDYFGLLDEDEGANVKGGLDIGIGRIPVKTLSEARQMVDKIIHYAENSEAVMGAWRNSICLIGDDQDYNAYVMDSEQLSDFINSEYKHFNVDKIYFDAYPQVSTPGGQRYPEVKNAINEKIEKGALIVNYIGHGGETGWAHERVLETQDINAWQNYDRLPLFVTATCEFTRFDDPELVSAGELVLLNKAGGGIALLTTTRATSAGANLQLNKQVFKYLFEELNGEYLRLGDIIKHSKNAIGNVANAQKFVLVGDPALKISIPQDSIATLNVNNQAIKVIPDTLSAMAEVSFSGSVFKKDGAKNSNFNGLLFPIVYDKPSKIKTLGQDEDSYEQEFNIQSNILYKGKVSVSNGDFTFSFVVPKDIAYNYGFGKISYYAQSEVSDARGCFENIIIGGYNEEMLTDVDGPVIKLFMNDSCFENGGITNDHPVIYAMIDDESGINTIGTGIGHDIVAVIDGDIGQTYILNEYYESDLNSHTGGTINYSLNGLSEGIHTLSLKAWDILNNSSAAMITFEVINQGSTVIKDIKNFPNPFVNNTFFSFKHNQANSSLNFVIQIFSLDGKKVKTIKKSMTPVGFSSDIIPWDGTSDSGSKLDAGIYIYRILIDGKELAGGESQKLMILK